ncbi:probable cytochrome P450 6a14 [Culex quinquefasciatus]|uniref:probable cytochrome P450 6a14 n=1 Tax=Culex quinquefasciatus TaxID=7176 RepID=UPI0018E2D71D|nr:probable cytochrome P450 6a14 [Culex quinquefasciatus]
MGLLNTILYLVVPVFALFYLFLRRKYSYWADRNVPHEPGQFPMGSLKGMGSKYHLIQITDRIYSKFKGTGSMAGFYVTLSPTVLVTDLELVKQILVKDFNSFRDRGMYYNEKEDPLSAHLFSIEGEKWRYMRNKLSPTFTSGKIKYMFLTMQEIGDEFVQSFDKYAEAQEPVDMKALAQRFTCDVIGSCAFGLNCNSLKNEGSELLAMGDKVFKLNQWQMLKAFFVMSYRDLSLKLGLRQLPVEVTDYFMNVIQGTVDHREKNNVVRPDFLQLLMQLKNKGTIEDHAEDSADKITMDQAAAQAFLFFFAGFETSSTALSFAIFELANNPDIQEKARAEVQRVLAVHGGHLTYEAIKDMTYLEQVVNESLRMYPPVGNIIRIANQPYQLTSPNVVIEKGTMVMIPAYSIQRDPDIYPNPSQFDPDRFTPEAIQARHTHTFLPFGDGPRNCIGMRFALLEVKFGIAQLLSRLSFTLNSRVRLPLELETKSSMMEIKGGLWLDVKKI